LGRAQPADRRRARLRGVPAVTARAASRKRAAGKKRPARPKRAATASRPAGFDALLVANRGEIARRVFRSARAMGIRCVAVYVDAAAAEPHVTDADEALRIATSYLDGKAILDAARASGARAIHPGYGFLSENAAFAADVAEAGLVWVGPPPEAIERMGDKLA